MSLLPWLPARCCRRAGSSHRREERGKVEMVLCRTTVGATGKYRVSQNNADAHLSFVSTSMSVNVPFSFNCASSDHTSLSCQLVAHRVLNPLAQLVAFRQENENAHAAIPLDTLVHVVHCLHNVW